MDGGKKHTMVGANGLRWEMDEGINGIREEDEWRTERMWE